MVKVGLTGGIGSGKSEVARLFAECGAVVVDADRIAREVVEPGTPGLAAIVDEFGAEVLTPEGRLDRPRLAALVFADPERRAALNAIVHPLVGERSAELERAARQADPDAVVVHDVPLLVENGLAQLYDTVVVVDAAAETRLDRLVRLRGTDEDEARARMAAQAGREERLAVADLVIDNNGPLAELAPRVREIWSELHG
ncbi:dephospho-CoA kinase [Streptomyces sp. NPDC006992]|uniref:dephospho-CoA kinase n=1 Tax=unclassified Streptomyces TaxID=2593676 RepID=UPI0033DB639C